MSECNHLLTSVFHFIATLKRMGHIPVCHCICARIQSCMYIDANKEFLFCSVFRELMAMTSNTQFMVQGSITQSRSRAVGCSEVLMEHQHFCYLWLPESPVIHPPSSTQLMFWGISVFVQGSCVCQVIGNLQQLCCLSQSICRLKNNMDRKLSILSRLTLEIICVSAFLHSKGRLCF